MTGLVLDHVGLSVADVDAQARWYADALGLTITGRFELPAIGLAGAFVRHPDGWAIELLHREGFSPREPFSHPNTALLTSGYGHVCLRVDDLDATHARLLAAGALERMTPRDSPEPGVRMSFVADPEGNLIELLDRCGPVGS